MERSFPVVISELRKERGLSQKEAAAKLGISQALLSHYEKGIRECGQSFLIRLADFYDVSCDYLLGRTKERTDVSSVAENLLDANNDIAPNSKTYIKAALIIREMINSSGVNPGLKLDMVLATAVYRLLLIQAYAGNIPKNWVGRAYVDGQVVCNPFYLNTIDVASYNAFDGNVNHTPMPDAPVPEAIETLVNSVEEFIFRAISEQTPPMPIEYIK